MFRPATSRNGDSDALTTRIGGKEIKTQTQAAHNHMKLLEIFL
jgi:hypothetical protein